MERIRSEAAWEGEMLLGWKWITSLLVLLSYSVMIMMWLPRPQFHTAPKTFVLSDDELLRHLNLSSSLITFTTSCEKFLLEEGYNEDVAESETTPIQGWSGGEWHYSWADSTDFKCYLQQQKVLGDGSVGADREATFSVKQTTHDDWLGMGPIHAVEGILVLRNFGDWVLSMDSESVYSTEAPELKVDFNQMLAMQNMKIFLKGAFVNTGVVGRRLCMTGCAYRNDHSYRIDCGFILKVTYPNRHSITSTRQIEAELSTSRTRVNDPLRFPAFRIAGPTLDIVESGNHSAPDFDLQSAENNNVNDNAQSTVDADQDRATLVEDFDLQGDTKYSG